MMKKILFLVSTVYVVVLFGVAIPAMSTSSSIFISKYEASDKEKIMIEDVYSSRSKVVQVAAGSVLVVYGLFAASVLLDRKKR